MDTRLKNNKKFGFMIAALLIVAAVAVSLAVYPVFEKRAANYFTDVLHSNDFLQELLQTSCVLYKDITEQAEEREVSYSELFLETESEELSRDAEAESIEYNLRLIEEESMIEMTPAEWQVRAENAMDSMMKGWRSYILNGLAKEMDYCVIDNATGKSIKNTGRGIEYLGTEEADEDLSMLYPYYIRVSFDSVGNLASVSVKSTHSDELLKTVKVVMGNALVSNQFWSQNGSFVFTDAVGSFYCFNNDVSKIWHVETTIKNAPRNTTYIFALTAEQKEAFMTYGVMSTSTQRMWEEEYAYYQAGVREFYSIILGVLFIIGILLPRWKKYHLHELKGIKWHLEFLVAAMFFLGSIILEMTNAMMAYTNNNRLAMFFEKNYPWLWFPNLHGVFIWAVNILVLLASFGVWYYLVVSMSEVSVIGIRAFLRERSLIVRAWYWLWSKVKKWGLTLKEEVLHVDLREKTDKTVKKVVVVNGLILAVLCFMWMFGWLGLVIYSVVLYMLLRKYIGQIQEQYYRLLLATRSIAEGNLQTEFEGDWGVFESYKSELDKIQNGFKKAVEEEVKSQRMKTELITNVSHDLKTPLTAITTYVELLKEKDVTEEQRQEYLAVLEKKSARLKLLIEDLFEVSKASSGNVTLNPIEVDICHLMRQVYLEYEDKAEAAGLQFRFGLPEEKVILQLDSQKTYRIFDNLYSNIMKYAMPHTRVYVSAKKLAEELIIEMKNMSAIELNMAPEELTERFVRGDASRNTEGSGLGLAIARSFTELQKGKMQIEIDGDLFKVTLTWRI